MRIKREAKFAVRNGRARLHLEPANLSTLNSQLFRPASFTKRIGQPRELAREQTALSLGYHDGGHFWIGSDEGCRNWRLHAIENKVAQREWNSSSSSPSIGTGPKAKLTECVILDAA
jgi:hypothetical protein